MSEDVAKARIAVAVSRLTGEIEGMISFERAAYLVAWEALSQLAGEVGIEAAAKAAADMAARLGGRGDVR
jgi:hypothetical protein